MSKTVYQIYDKMFKKILTLSSTAVINLINGLFDTDYPSDSTIHYNWTEFEDGELKRILADTILTLNGTYSYHMEAQMTEDEDIIFRVFAYGYSHADRNRVQEGAGCVLHFPEPKIIYLYAADKVPDEYAMELDFGSQGSFVYKVSTFKFAETPVEELNRRKMAVLIPFALLKLRKTMEKERTPEKLEVLKKLIQDDIIGTIDSNLRAENITMDDARKLKRLTHRLYEHIYAHYEEMEELNEMTDESLMLDIDIIEKEHERELAEKERMMLEALEEKEKEKKEALEEKEREKKEALLLKDKEIKMKEAEIAALKDQLETKLQ